MSGIWYPLGTGLFLFDPLATRLGNPSLVDKLNSIHTKKVGLYMIVPIDHGYYAIKTRK